MRPCLFCGVMYRHSRANSKYCSEKCRKTIYKVRHREKVLEDARVYMKLKREREMVNRIPIYLQCVVCEKRFQQNKYHPEQKCCSNICNSKWYKRQPENKVRILDQKRQSYNRNQKTYAAYRAVYKDKLRFSGNRLKALTRDQFTCQNCRLGEPDVKLVVHHLDFSGQVKKPNNRIENLQTLCRSCHAHIHAHTIKT